MPPPKKVFRESGKKNTVLGRNCISSTGGTYLNNTTAMEPSLVFFFLFFFPLPANACFFLILNVALCSVWVPLAHTQRSGGGVACITCSTVAKCDSGDRSRVRATPCITRGTFKYQILPICFYFSSRGARATVFSAGPWGI